MREEPGGDDHDVESAERRDRAVERRAEAVRKLEIAVPVSDRCRLRGAARLEIDDRGSELGFVAAEQVQRVAALGEAARERPPHPLRRAEQDDLHGIPFVPFVPHVPL